MSVAGDVPRVSFERALEHIPDCSSYEPRDTSRLILASMPLGVTSYVQLAHSATQADEVQLFCESFHERTPAASQQQCYTSLREGVEDHSLFHQPAEPAFHPLTRAQILTELHTISCYIFYVLSRSQLISLARTPYTQDQQNKEEFHRFVSCVQSNVQVTPRALLTLPGGYLDLWRLMQQQTRRSAPGIDESLCACWCGVDFYTKWYRCVQPAYFVNYETFRVVRAASVAMFASVVAELTGPGLDDDVSSESEEAQP